MWKRIKQSVGFKTGPWGSGAALLVGGGAMLTTPATVAFGWFSIGIGTGLLLWGLRINGMYIWRPWWRGVPSPFLIHAGVNKFDYARGTKVRGIPWQQGFAHVYLTITNGSPRSLENVDALLAPDHPIIHSRAVSAFATCRIASLYGQGAATVVYKTPDGQTFGMTHEPDDPGNYTISPAHRLHCDNLPGGAVIEVDLATVAMEENPTMSLSPWRTQRTDPTSIRVRLGWSEGEFSYGVEHLLELKGIEP